MLPGVKEGDRVLLIWSGITPPEKLEERVHQLNSVVGPMGKVAVEHEERLKLSSHPQASFDTVLSGTVWPSALIHGLDLLEEVGRILKPNGKLFLLEPTGSTGGLRPLEKVVSSLKLAGFISISEGKQVNLTVDQTSELEQRFGDALTLIELVAFKPNFEVGSSSQLSLSIPVKSAKPKFKDENVAKIWTLSAQDIDDEEIDIVDSDTLLDDKDLQKPDPASLKSDCGTNKAGKKKACKNCTCGLAEEIDQEKASAKTTVTSSCGSCYLGDAFRCASCPYLGMPAFKPGEKVALTSRQLKGDL